MSRRIRRRINDRRLDVGGGESRGGRGSGSGSSSGHVLNKLLAISFHGEEIRLEGLTSSHQFTGQIATCGDTVKFVTQRVKADEDSLGFLNRQAGVGRG